MVFICFILIIIIFKCLKGQTISIYEYKQEESITNCTHGLVSDVDTVVFKANVDYSEDLNIKYVYFQLRKKNEPDFLLLYDINIKENCVVDKRISCEHIATNVVMIMIRVIAKKELSGARIRGVLIASNSEHITSDHHIFPEIADYSDITSKLFIDETEMTKTGNVYVANSDGHEVNFRFECESKVSPCFIEISENGLLKPLQGKSYVAHTFGKEVLNISIKLALCTLDHTYDTAICYVNPNSESNTEKRNSDGLQFNVIIIIGGIISLIVCFIILAITRNMNFQTSKKYHKLVSLFRKKKVLIKTKRKKKTQDDIDSDNGNTDSLLKEACSTSNDKSSKHGDVNGKTKQEEIAVIIEMNRIPQKTIANPILQEEKHKENQPMMCKAMKDIPLKQNRQEKHLVFLLDETQNKQILEKLKPEHISKSDDEYSFPDQTGRNTLHITSGISNSIKKFAENDAIDIGKSQKHQELQCQIKEVFKLILTRQNFNEDVSKDLSSNIININSYVDFNVNVTISNKK